MRFVVNFDQFFHRNLRVDLRRRKPRVSEKFLNVAQIRARIEQVRGEGMSQAVRRDVVNVGAEFDVFIDHSPDAAGRDARSLIIQENGLLVARRRRAVVAETSPRVSLR